MRRIYFAVAVMFIGFSTGMTGFTQTCESFFPADKGTFIEMKNYDEKGKVIGAVQQTITDVNSTHAGMTVKVQSETFDKKNESLGKQDLEMRCEKGVFYMDMKNYFNQAAMGGGEVTVDGTDLAFPANLKVGETLPDGSLSISTGIMTMSVNIFNRKVEAIENLTTPAGTFECYKMSFNMDTKMGIKMSNTAIQWVSKNVGTVRSETYSKNGKLMGYTELTAFRK